MKKNNQKGQALLIVLLVMAAFLSIALGVSTLSLGETKLSRDISKSLIAYYAADSGVECQMYSDRWPADGVNCASVCLSAGICFVTQISGTSPTRTIQSTGSYLDVRRAVELTY